MTVSNTEILDKVTVIEQQSHCNGVINGKQEVSKWERFVLTSILCFVPSLAIKHKVPPEVDHRSKSNSMKYKATIIKPVLYCQRIKIQG